MSKVAPSPSEASLGTESVSSQVSAHSTRGRSTTPCESKRSGLTSFSLPIPNPNASLKQRLSTMEESFDLQVQTNAAVDDQLGYLLSSATQLDSRLNEELDSLRNKLEDDIAWLRKEFNHK